MTNVLSGNYVVFGVFQVYNDTCFIQSLESMFSILDSECIAYTKLQEAMYEYLNHVTKNHMVFVV
jgi:hypothetical protein